MIYFLRREIAYLVFPNNDDNIPLMIWLPPVYEGCIRPVITIIAFISLVVSEGGDVIVMRGIYIPLRE